MSTHTSRPARSARDTTPVNRSTCHGHHSSSQTPGSYGPVPTPATEIADELDNQVGAELSDKLYLLPAEEFIKNL
ncbi:hypothetical protein FRB90_011081, partial [Tulasnella sp. 427]